MGQDEEKKENGKEWRRCKGRREVGRTENVKRITRHQEGDGTSLIL